MRKMLSYIKLPLLVAILLLSKVIVAQNTTPHYVNLDSLRPYSYDHVPDFTEDEVIERLAKIEKRIKLNYNRKVLGFIDYFVVRNRAYSKMVLARKDMYFPIFEAALKRHGLPDELKYLAIVESGLKNTAKSGVGACGLWQFMSPTGKMYSLDNNSFVDERMDPYKATEAACKYLKWLYNYFGDWELALASYNCGPGYVKRALQKAGNVNNFWAVYNFLPQETRSYVPQFVAIAYMVNFHNEHNIYPETKEFIWNYEHVNVWHKIDLKAFCKESGLCYDDVKRLNPEVRTHIIPGNLGVYNLKVPKDVSSKLKENYLVYAEKAKIQEHVSQVLVAKLDTTTIDSSSTDSATTLAVAEEIKEKPKTHKVQGYHILGKGQHLYDVAKMYGVEVSDLKKWNKTKISKLRKGTKLIVWREVPIKDANHAIAKHHVYKVLKKVHYVQAGDTLWTISKKYGGVPIAKLKKINKIKGTNLKLGQKIIIS